MARSGVNRSTEVISILRYLTLVASISLVETPEALAQVVPAAPPKAVPKAGTDEIVVTAGQQAQTSSIDRKVYSISGDLQSVAGSASDVLDRLPSVDVDAQGAISIRGDSNVQILIDGKPSSATSSSNRGDYLQQIPAGSIDTIEVITNPSARFKPDGATGVINIILKKNRKPGRSGSALASVGSDGRFNLGVTPSYHAGPLTLNASATLKRDVPYRTFGDERSQTDATGATVDSSQDGHVESRRLSEIVTASADYDLTAADRLTASGTYNRRAGPVDFIQHDRIVDRVGPVLADFDRIGSGSERQVTTEASARYRHAFAEKGHELTIDVRRGQTLHAQSRRFTNSYDVPAGLVTIDEQSPHSDEVEREVTVEYARPFTDGGKLLLGYDLERDDDDYDNRGDSVDPVSGAVTADPSLTNRFDYRQTIHALYGTYERPLATKLTAILGLRYEATIRDTAQVTTGQNDHDRYDRIYPTLHLEYALSEARTLRLSYSHRIVRPDAEDLNPYPLFQNPLNLRAGNPNLRPQETDAVEASYQYAATNGVSWEITPYVRASRKVFSDVSRLIAPTVLLTTRENLGKSLAAGSEFSGSGKLGRSLSYTLSGNVYYSRINAANLGIDGSRSTVSVSGKASVDYRATAKDLVQVSVTYGGRRLTPQGTRRSAASTNLGFRHQLKPGLAAVLTVTDVFDSARDRITLDTGTVHDVSSFRRARRAVSFALNWNFGAGGKPPAKFDYTE